MKTITLIDGREATYDEFSERVWVRDDAVSGETLFDTIAALQEKIEKLESALQDAIELAEDGLSYKGDYYVAKRFEREQCDFLRLILTGQDNGKTWDECHNKAMDKSDAERASKLREAQE